MGRDLLGEFALKTGEHIVELQGVGREVHPLGGGREDGEGLTGPQPVRGAPGGYVGDELLGVLVETVEVASPLQVALAGLDVLEDDASPLGVRNAVGDLLDGLLRVEVLDAEVLADLDVLCELLVGLVVLVVEGAAVETHDTRESVHVVYGSRSCNLGTETVTTDRRHRDLVLVHKSHDIIGCVLHARTTN